MDTQSCKKLPAGVIFTAYTPSIPIDLQRGLIAGNVQIIKRISIYTLPGDGVNLQ
jgi:hypothetical protein